MKKQILIIAGEASGDHYGAALALAIHQKNPDITLLGMGGDKMRKAGVDIRVDAGPLGVIGLIEVLSHIVPIYRAWKTLKTIMKQARPDLLVLIDYPAFNLRIAKVAKSLGIPVLYYISPKIWAWNRRRIKKIGERVDKMLVIFPFEEALYREKNIPVEYVGHPLAESVCPDKDVQTMRAELKIDHSSGVIGLLPGSRKGEIKRLLPVMLLSAEKLKARYPDTVFVLPLANSLTLADLAPYLQKTTLDIKIVSEQFYNTVQLCSAAIVVSGTATLETALLQVPMVIVYKTAASTYAILKRIIQIPYIGLCNIIAEKMIVKELIQQKATPDTISAEISHILENDVYRYRMQKSLLSVKEKLGQGGSIARVARIILDIVKE